MEDIHPWIKLVVCFGYAQVSVLARYIRSNILKQVG